MTRAYGGTGLGLSISSQLVGAMGGTIGVDSAPGAGSTFHFRIPLTTSATAVVRDTFSGIDPKATRLLIVDDSAVIHETLGESLGRLNFQIEVAASGTEALAKWTAAHEDPFDAIIVDWKMPGMDGLQTITELRDAAQGDEAPVVMMISVDDMAEIEDELARLGVTHTVQKPINTSFMVD